MTRGKNPLTGRWEPTSDPVGDGLAEVWRREADAYAMQVATARVTMESDIRGYLANAWDEGWRAGVEFGVCGGVEGEPRNPFR